MSAQFTIQWLDSGREPQCQPNPAFPNGVDLDPTEPGEASCRAELPYPAKRCGVYHVTCHLCGIRVAVTTAGRPDDPRSVRIPCIITGNPSKAAN